MNAPPAAVTVAQAFTQDSAENLAGSPMHNPFGHWSWWARATSRRQT